MTLGELKLSSLLFACAMFVMACTESSVMENKINAGNHSVAGLAESHAPAPSEPGDRGVAPTASAPSPAPTNAAPQDARSELGEGMLPAAAQGDSKPLRPAVAAPITALSHPFPPDPLCQSQVRRVAETGEIHWAQLRTAVAMQADGGRWVISCSYGTGNSL